MSITPPPKPKVLVAPELDVFGMDCQTSPYLLPPGRYQDILNSTFDPLGALTSRKGFTKYSGTAFGTYNSGVATFTKGNTAVTGSETQWLTHCLVRGLIHKADEDTWYEISAIGGETSITLDRAYEGETSEGASYLITVERVVGMCRYYKKDGTKKFLLVAGDDLWDIPDASPHTPAKVDAGVDFGPNSPASFALFGDKVYIADGINNLRRYDASALEDAGFAAPTEAPTLAEGDAGDLDSRFYGCYTFVFPTGESNGSPISTLLDIEGKKINWSNIAVGPTGCIARNLYRTRRMPPAAPDSAPTLSKGAGTMTGTYKTKASFGFAGGETLCGPESDPITLSSEGLAFASIPLGPAGCTSRKIYLTRAGGSIFYLALTIADNSTTGYPPTGYASFYDSFLTVPEPATEPEKAYYYVPNPDSEKIYTIDNNEDETFTGDEVLDDDLLVTQAPTDHNLPPTGLAVVIAHQTRLFGIGEPDFEELAYYSAQRCGDIWKMLTDEATYLIIPTEKNESLLALIGEGDDLILAMANRFDLVRGRVPPWERATGHHSIGTTAPNGMAKVENGVFIPSLLGIYAYQANLAFPISEPVTPLLGADRLTPAFLKLAAALWREHRYYLAYSDNELITGINSGLLLFETKSRLWGRNTGICASHFCVFDGEGDEGEVFFADPRDGYIYQMNQGDTDNGTPIEWSVTSRPVAFERAGLGIKKQGREISCFVKASDGDLLCEYALDDGGFVEAGTATLSGGILKRYDFNLPVTAYGETITVRFSSSRTSQLIYYGFLVLGSVHERRWG